MGIMEYCVIFITVNNTTTIINATLFLFEMGMIDRNGINIKDISC